MIAEESILIAADLAPSDTAQLNLDYVRGFITEVGSRTSHSAIMARSLEIPAIVGVGKAAAEIADGAWVIMDAAEGKILVDPSEEELKAYRDKKKNGLTKGKPSFVSWPGSLRSQKTAEEWSSPPTSAVWKTCRRWSTTGPRVSACSARSFLYMGRNSLPTEEEQFQVYKYVLEKNGEQARCHPDAGYRRRQGTALHEASGGKQSVSRPSCRPSLPGPPRLVPYSIEGASPRQPARRAKKIMFPMIAVMEELLEAKRLLQEEKDKLIAEGIEVAGRIEVGMMIEVPAAALAADALAKEVDFFSIGTNDLIQYTMAADRMNETVSYLYQPCHPSILRLIRMVISAAEREGRCRHVR